MVDLRTCMDTSQSRFSILAYMYSYPTLSMILAGRLQSLILRDGALLCNALWHIYGPHLERKKGMTAEIQWWRYTIDHQSKQCSMITKMCKPNAEIETINFSSIQSNPTLQIVPRSHTISSRTFHLASHPSKPPSLHRLHLTRRPNRAGNLPPDRPKPQHLIPSHLTARPSSDPQFSKSYPLPVYPIPHPQ